MAVMRTLRIAVLATAVVAAGGCGYTLRQSSPLPEVLGAVAIKSVNPDSPLIADLERELQGAGATLRPLNSAGVSTLRIDTDQIERNVISLDARAKVGEYELNYRVIYAVDAADGKALLPNTPISLSRTYSFDEQQAIGAGQEEELIKTELRRDVVRIIMERLQRIKDPNRAVESRTTNQYEQ
jgi:LPS-assembly lipoprotein